MMSPSLKICELNAENLFISMAYYAGEDLHTIREEGWRSFALRQLQKKQKPLAKVQGLAGAVLDIDPDVLMLVEVGGQESLENFNHYFLDNRFEPYFVEGNATRGIDLGFLVRRGLPYRVETLSNREAPIEVTAWQSKFTAKFSRDVAELRLHSLLALDHAPGGDPALILLLTHLKSKISKSNDVQGKDVRTAEAIALAGIYEARRASYPTVPIIVGGDFNAPLASLELELLRRTDLVDFHDVLGTPETDRTSLIYFTPGGKAVPEIIDYLLVSPQLKNRIIAEKSGIYRYRGFYGIQDSLPTTLKERYRMHSDHYPLVLTVALNPHPHSAPQVRPARGS